MKWQITRKAIMPFLLMLSLYLAACARVTPLSQRTEPQEHDVERLIQNLEGSRWPGKRVRAARALGDIKDPRALEALIAALEDKNVFVRSKAAAALGKIGNSRAVDPLIAALENRASPDPHYPGLFRCASAWALGKIKDPRAIEPLLFQLNQEDPSTKLGAAWALGKYKEQRAVERLIADLKHKSLKVRWTAVWALGEIKDRRAVEPLISCLKNESFRKQSLLGRWGELEENLILEPLNYFNLSWDIISVVHDALRKMAWSPNTPAAKALLSALRSKDFAVVIITYDILLSIGEPGTEDILAEALEKHGNEIMAHDFLACGNLQLVDAGSQWVRANSVKLTVLKLLTAFLDGMLEASQRELIRSTAIIRTKQTDLWADAIYDAMVEEKRQKAPLPKKRPRWGDLR